MATQLNFAQQMDAVLKTLDGTRPRLLLHACCGPSVFNTSSICCAKFNCFDIGFILCYTCFDSNSSLLLPRQKSRSCRKGHPGHIISHFI